MNAHPPARPGLFGRPVLTVAIVLGVLVGAGAGGVALAGRSPGGKGYWHEPAVASAAAPASPRATLADEGPGAPAAATVLELSATGDIIMGSAPGRLPARDGAGFFDSVRSALRADLVMGNLEQPLTDNTGSVKCGSPPRPNCYAFRAPPSYARHLKEAGFELLNTANNHSRDFGVAGYRNTVAALERAGLQHTGAQDQITVVTVKGVKVAVLGFSPYAGTNDLNDLAHAREIVGRAAQNADIVVVQAHLGAEGSDKTHVRPGSELFFGENRGDPLAFTEAVVEAGADVVIAHGPHVLRGMRFYKGKLIAYSLGNFAGGGRTLSRTGVLGYGGVLHVKLTADGQYVGGRFLSTYMNGAGVPIRDSAHERGRELVAELSKADFGRSAARIGGDGSITAPA